jgi:NADH-quinone oxidoreductase subunit L
MVAAGVYLVARTYPLFVLSAGHQALWVVAYIGGVTALVAATMGVVEDDIKRVLAYSTMSQLGYMMMGLGVLGYTAGMFHLLTHAFFKALLFLGAGSVIHVVATNNMKEMGGLARAMPVTFWTFLVATLALTGIPPFSGFFSKDAILLAAYTHDKLLWAIGTFGAFLTALYMGLLLWYTFAGSFRGGAAGGGHDARDAAGGGGPHLHESPRVMTVPLVILAACTVGLGFLEHPFERLVRFEGAEAPASNAGLLVISVLVAVAGWAAAGAIYRWRIVPSEVLRQRFGSLYTLLVHKYYVDDVYGWVFLKAGGVVMWAAGAFDRYVVDGLVNAAGWIAGQMGLFLRYLQTGREENYLLLIFLSVVVIVLVRFVR